MSTPDDSLTKYDEYDELLGDAARIIVETGKPSTSLLQTRLKLGYLRAHRIMRMLADNGIVKNCEPADMNRVLIISMEELNEKLKNLKPIENGI